MAISPIRVSRLFRRKRRYLQAADWDDVFFDAERLGIRIVFLSGGEPLMRRCILEKAANHHRIFSRLLRTEVFWMPLIWISW